MLFFQSILLKLGITCLLIFCNFPQKPLSHHILIRINSQKIIQKSKQPLRMSFDDPRQSLYLLQKKDIDMIKCFANPPSLVLGPLKLIGLIINPSQPNSSWAQIRQMMIKPDFLNKMISFSPENLSPQAKQRVLEFISQEKMDSEQYKQKAKKCSVAAYHMLLWGTSIMKF